MERNQEWRKIGSTWLSCALELKASDSKMVGEYLDPEATIHNFPHFDVDKWATLSQIERAGRAYRYAAYHFEADGDRQSSYRLYRASAKCYEEEKKYDEAGRSHFLSLKSFINRFGEVDRKYLSDLEKSTKISVNYDELLYLKRMIIYYRTLDSLLKSKGNFLASLEMRKKRVDAERLLLKKAKTYHLYILSSIWNFFTGCGQSPIRWIITLLITTLLIFPAIYRWIDCLGQSILFKDALIFSISRLVNYNVVSYTPTSLGHFIIIVQGIFILFWVGALLSIIVSRIQN